MSGKRGIHAKTASMPELIRSLGRQNRELIERAEKAKADLASLRARVREYLAAIDFDDDETAPPDLCEACQRTEQAKAALRTEVERG